MRGPIRSRARAAPAALVCLAALHGACSPAPESLSGPAWALVSDDVRGSVLSCAAATPDDVYFAGTDGLLLRYDGATFEPIETGVQEWLWWVWACSPSEIWVVGDRGVALRVVGGVPERVTTGTAASLFGVWGASCDDVWAVGGSPLGGGPNDVVLRGGRDGLLAQALPEAPDVPLFKVWGTSSSDLFAVGGPDVIWHYDGSGWARQSNPCTSGRLFTVSGNAPDNVYVVGSECAVHYDGAQWSAVAGLELGPAQPNGVDVAPDGTATIVGFGSLKVRGSAEGSWRDQSADAPIGTDLHAACGDGRGGVFTVGGNFLLADAPQRGVIGHFGVAHPAADGL